MIDAKHGPRAELLLRLPRSNIVHTVQSIFRPHPPPTPSSATVNQSMSEQERERGRQKNGKIKYTRRSCCARGAYLSLGTATTNVCVCAWAVAEGGVSLLLQVTASQSGLCVCVCVKFIFIQKVLHFMCSSSRNESSWQSSQSGAWMNKGAG